MDGAPTASIRAVLFTDVVGSTELRTALGELAADVLRRHHDELLGAVVVAHAGRVLRWTGDGLKAEFPLASAAVSAAIDMQRAVAKYSRSAAAVAPFQIRIGVSAGEVSDDDGDLHGVAVIEGARLEALAAPGEILATDLVARLGRRRVDAGFEEVGPRVLKGLDDPVQVVRVVDLGADGAAPPVPMALTLDRRFPLVGRAEPLAILTHRWQQACAGTTSTVLLAGHPGIGKSRLIAQMADAAHAGGALVLAGICDSELSRPYQPFAMAFGEVQALDEELSEAVTRGLGPLAPLFPSRRAGRSDDAGAAARFELFDAVVDLVERLSAEQPVVLVLEDLQWATAPTVQLLRHLVREAKTARVLVLGSYRVDEVGPAHPMSDVLAEVHASAVASRIDLRALDVDDVSLLVLARVPNAPEVNVQSFARRVRDESGGNPFFVCELLHHLGTTGELERLIGSADVDRLPIPDSVRDVVGQRLARLAPETGNVLASAATIGMSFDLELLAALVDQPAETVLGVLEDVARVALVQESAAGRFSFAHAILRSTLLDSMTATRRSLLHRRVAECIELLRPSDHDELAHHWQLAGNESRANERLELAARRDLEALAYESAAERYQSLVEYYGRAPDQYAALARSWLGLGLARRALGMPDYLPAVIEAGRLARRLRDADLIADAALASIWPGTFFITAGVTDAGLVELTEDALESIADDDPRRARLLATLASHLTFHADRGRRAAVIDAAHTHARGDGDPALTGTVLVAEYLALWDPTTFDRRGEIAKELARAARASGDAELAFFAGFFAAIGAVERGDVVAARRHLAGLDEPVRLARNFYLGFLAERLSTSLDILCGRADVQVAIDALAERYAGTHADTVGTWSVQTGGVAWQRGGLGALVPTVRELIGQGSVSNWLAAYGLAMFHAGDRDGAMTVLDGFVEPTLDYFWLTTMQAYAELAVALDRRDMASQLFASLMPHRGQLGVTASGSLCLGLVSTSLGELALATGDHLLAHELLVEARQAADAMGAPFEATKTRRLLAAALDAAGETEAAAVARAEALALADRHGFDGERRHLEAAPAVE
ncbi:MAG: AAA family ATPase [Actinomycetota bacterium]|nr:AAA family ATPase [Actinomycetota bacterium]